ncbi:MAG: hypothetical protein M3Z96_00475 [Pseudomonadota bacterium]|nr:hypothetical protein [Pseudomonadota bacterium]MDQ6867241.1 hypothetical protein [Pseudomonadota bacterium]
MHVFWPGNFKFGCSYSVATLQNGRAINLNFRRGNQSCPRGFLKKVEAGAKHHVQTGDQPAAAPPPNLSISVTGGHIVPTGAAGGLLSDNVSFAWTTDQEDYTTLHFTGVRTSESAKKKAQSTDGEIVARYTRTDALTKHVSIHDLFAMAAAVTALLVCCPAIAQPADVGLDEIQGTWNHDQSGENITISGNDVFDSRFGQGRIGSTIEHAANFVIVYNTGNEHCWFYITPTSKTRVNLAVRQQDQNAKDCLSGPFNLVVTAPNIDLKKFNSQANSVLKQGLALGSVYSQPGVGEAFSFDNDMISGDFVVYQYVLADNSDINFDYIVDQNIGVTIGYHLYVRYEAGRGSSFDWVVAHLALQKLTNDLTEAVGGTPLKLFTTSRGKAQEIENIGTKSYYRDFWKRSSIIQSFGDVTLKYTDEYEMIKEYMIITIPDLLVSQKYDSDLWIVAHF